MPMMTLLGLALVYTLLLVVLAVVSAMETASFATRDASDHYTKLKPGPLKDSLQSILSNPFRHLHRTLLVSAALNLALTTFLLYVIYEPLRDLGYSPWVTAPVLFGGTVVLGDVMPKFFAMRSPSRALVASASFLHYFRHLLDPVTGKVERLSEKIIHLMIPRAAKTRQSVTLEELETLVEMREEQGVIDKTEASILSEVIGMAELTVRDCMVPRVDVVKVAGSKSSDTVHQLLETTVARFVVIYGETPDHVMGIIDVQEWKMKGRPRWHVLLRDAVFVPESFPVLDALTQMLRSPADCVLVSDEYGGLDGMVTQEEIVDWLLNEAAPWQGEAAEFRPLNEDNSHWMADGGARVDDIAEALDVEIECSGIDTIGGYVFNELGHLPRQGERLKTDRLEIKVRRVSRQRIEQVEIRVLPPPKDDDDAATEEEEL